jgi:hypothetical protein
MIFPFLADAYQDGTEYYFKGSEATVLLLRIWNGLSGFART